MATKTTTFEMEASTDGIAADDVSLRTQFPGGHQRWRSSPPSLAIRTPVTRFRNPAVSARSPLSSASSSSSSSSAHSRRRDRILSSRGALSPDRFIPSSSSVPLYHVETPPSSVSPPGLRGRRNTTAGARSSLQPDPGIAIASALGISSGLVPRPGRVLNFQKRLRPTGDTPSANDDERVNGEAMMMVLAGASAKGANHDGEARTRKSQKIKKRVLSYAPFRVLDAPGLRDDFYTNLLAWSSVTNDLAVGLGPEVYIWQESTGAVLLPEWSTSPVACVSFAPDGRTLVIGRMDGAITCWAVSSPTSRAEFYHTVGLCCIGWRPIQTVEGQEQMYSEFYVGDEVGEILRFKLLSEDAMPRTELSPLELLGRTKGHNQQICVDAELDIGITFNPSGTQMAVGANDNTCTVWDMTLDGPAASPRYRWDHRAAVKALAYCPWSPSLLATGGGSNDRTIRFWHTNSGSLVNSFNTNAQVTSLIWSRSTKEIVATFGYANPEHPIRMAIYSYPECRPIIQIPWQEDIRCLYAVQSPGGGRVCAAASDETVRFYDFWDEKGQIRVSHWDNGIFGSDILELCEGIEKNPLDVIR
ncbi:WD40-repeat-containing domain protein [Lipomyces kononenkoae]|uniref:WD40-repeat-containing domain protein n=1 Tax=Lipomyces kononenkoae TaxID=34357 RepID=A0ACC3T448_LIPKO